MSRAGATLHRLALVVLVAVAAAVPLHAASRVVAIGDVHGAVDGLTSILRESGLIDAAGKWVGGDAILTQTGDLLDRGTAVREVMDLMMRLQNEAAAAGGEVVVLLGNHEQMNLIQHFRDVNPAAYAAFGGEESAAARNDAFARWKAWEQGGPAAAAATRQRFDQLYPAGSLAYRQALGPDGRYGRWLRSLPVAAIRAGVLFQHAGLSAQYADLGVEEIDARHRQTFADLDAVRHTLTTRAGVPEVFDFFALMEATARLMETARGGDAPAASLGAEELTALASKLEDSQWMSRAEAPLWFRGYAEWSDEQLAPHLAALFKRHGVDRVVAAHSPSATGTIRARAEGALLLIDTGMLAEVYGGRPAALVMEATGISAVYPGERQLLVPAAPRQASAAAALPARVLRGSDGQPVPFRDDEEVLAFLREAEVVSSRVLGEGVTHARKVELRRGTVQLAGIFHDIDEASEGTRLGGERQTFFIDSWRGQVAAYEVCHLLGFDTVPPTVERTLDGQRGSLQLWVGETKSWKKLREAGQSTPRVNLQWHDVRVFDNLINNRDRNQGNILVDRDGYLWWIDHTRAFDRETTLPKPSQLRRISRQLWEALPRLEAKSLHQRLDPLLSKFEVDAVLARRELLLAAFRAAIATGGEGAVLFDRDAPPPPDVILTDCADAECPDPAAEQ